MPGSAGTQCLSKSASHCSSPAQEAGSSHQYKLELRLVACYGPDASDKLIITVAQLGQGCCLCIFHKNQL